MEPVKYFVLFDVTKFTWKIYRGDKAAQNPGATLAFPCGCEYNFTQDHLFKPDLNIDSIVLYNPAW